MIIYRYVFGIGLFGLCVSVPCPGFGILQAKLPISSFSSKALFWNLPSSQWLSVSVASYPASCRKIRQKVQQKGCLGWFHDSKTRFCVLRVYFLTSGLQVHLLQVMEVRGQNDFCSLAYVSDGRNKTEKSTGGQITKTCQSQANENQ